MKLLNTKGFTLFELLVILGIISVMAAFVIIPYSQLSNQAKIRTKAYEIAQIINKAEALSLAGYQVVDKIDNKEKSANIYVKFDKNNNKITLQGLPYGVNFPPTNLNNVSLIDDIDLEKSVLTNLADDFYILFKAPNATAEYYLGSNKIANLANVPKPKLKIGELPEYDLNIK